MNELTPDAAFWEPRDCFVRPLPEHELAAELFDHAGHFLLRGQVDAAADCVARADIPELRAYAARLLDEKDAAVLRIRAATSPRAPLITGPRMPSEATIREVYARDGYRCRFCGVRVIPPATRKLLLAMLNGAFTFVPNRDERHGGFRALSATPDHVLPYSRGGASDARNIVTACWPCNFGRGALTIEQVGLRDPRQRPPVLDDWDGLMRLTRLSRPVTARTLHPPEIGKQAAVGEAERGQQEFAPPVRWFLELERHQPGAALRLADFLEACMAAGATWRIGKVLLIYVPYKADKLSVIGVESNGNVHIPWWIGPHKDAFKTFAQTVSTAVPMSTWYETDKLWTVRNPPRSPLRLDQLVDASESVCSAIVQLLASQG